ncbi:MAG: carbamoyltransferase C-terminal domain-containing protein [Planctomycetaceae bacterium]
MAKNTGSIGGRWPLFGDFCGWMLKVLARPLFTSGKVFQLHQQPAQAVLKRFQEKIARGESGLVVGLGVAGHNAGVALAKVSAEKGIEFLANDEEERFTGIKHYGEFPKQGLLSLQSRLQAMGKTADDVDAWCLSWDYIAMGPNTAARWLEEFPYSWRNILQSAMPKLPFVKIQLASTYASKQIRDLLGMQQSPTLLSLPHHENHAAFSYAVSPFAADGKDTLVLVLDGLGDEGAISVFKGNSAGLQKMYCNESFVDSLGLFYSVISSTQGGWTTLSSEGRYMGAAAWGDSERLTNRYYKLLREIFHFAPKGEIFINRQLTNWQNSGEIIPYKARLSELIGPPISRERMWNPDAVLSVDDVEHAAITKDRVDMAAATQLVFEDALFHIIDHYVRTTGIDRLVMTGGTALNCVANMRLLEHYNEAWFTRNFERSTKLQIWVPPIPGDAGVTIGAAYQFSLRAGAKCGPSLEHAFYCGMPPTTEDIDAAIQADDEIEFRDLGSIHVPEELEDIADMMAYIMSQNGVLGIFQGSAETGPRALGHRSILANPCNPLSLQIINERVKFREKVRPLAPMVTREAAEKFWDLAPGAAANNYTAYNYMVLTVPANKLGHETVPAVVHFDGTSRIQIVRPECDPLTHAYLKAMGRHVGAEVSVNTSLNVGSPIAQTPKHALDTMKRAKSLSGLIMVGANGQARLAWHTVDIAPKDGGRQLNAWLTEWEELKSTSPA